MGGLQDDNDTDEDPRGLCGLQNLGNTCYMNGALQALSNCQQLTRFVLDCPGYLKSTGLSHCYAELIREIWDSSRPPSTVPVSIIRGIKGIYPSFRGYSQQDTQEFLRCFLEQLHEELKQPINPADRMIAELPNNPTGDEGDEDRCTHYQPSNSQKTNSQPSANHVKSNGQDNSEASTPNSETSEDSTSSATDHFATLNQELRAQHPLCNICINNRKAKKKAIQYRSIISDTFDFKILSSVQCSSCRNISTRKESMKDLSLPIPTRDHPYWMRANGASALVNGSKSTATSNPSPTSSSFSNKQKQPSEENLIASDEDKQVQVSRSLAALSIHTAYNWVWDWLSLISTWLWGPSVQLDDCLSVFFGADPLEGDNEYSCERCKRKNKGVKYLKILDLPEILCIHFKRYESINSAKITTHVSFPLEGLDMAPYMSSESKSQCTTYNLVACICHHGSALLTGHYTTYALNRYNDQWYEFDDQYVTMVQSYQVENSEAYILFYQKALNDDTIEQQRNTASELLRQHMGRTDMKKYLISRQWINRFNTFVEPGPITNHDFLCQHERIPKSKWPYVKELYHEVSAPVWIYLHYLHGGGPVCHEPIECEQCMH